ncbi:MAG: type II and III secretion system protein [Methylococcales bacterium]
MFKILLIFLVTFYSAVNIADEQIIKVLPLHNRLASDIQSIIGPILENSERVIPNRSSLIIKATAARQKELKKLIEQLDRRLNNLTITVIQSRSKTADSLNASAYIKSSSPSQNRKKVSTSLQGYFADTERLNHAENQQKIQTLDGKSAFIKTGKIHPINNISFYQSSNGYSAITKDTQYIDVSTGFLVTPHLSGKQVTLDITPWSDQIKNNGEISYQHSHTTIRVNLGEWIEIGSVNEQSQTASNRNLSLSYSTSQKKNRILLKVDKTQ